MCLWWNSTVEISPIFNEVLYMSVWKFNISNISDRFCWVFINNGDIPKLLMFWRNNAEFTFNKLSYKSSNLHIRMSHHNIALSWIIIRFTWIPFTSWKTLLLFCLCSNFLSVIFPAIIWITKKVWRKFY